MPKNETPKADPDTAPGRMDKKGDEAIRKTGEPSKAPEPKEINPEGGGPREEGAGDEGGGIGPVTPPATQPDLSEASAATMVRETVGSEPRPSEEVSDVTMPGDMDRTKHAHRKGDTTKKDNDA